MIRKASIGRALARGDAGFDEALHASSFSAYDSGKRPDHIYQANNADDVIAAVKVAIAENKKISIVSGGHSFSQNHIRDGGILLDVSRLNAMEIDARNKTAIIGPGCLSGDLDAALAKKGLLFPVAHAYTVGMGGFLLQGGFGWDSQVVGIACESVMAIDVVLADGSLVHASETENADLLWAARGAGPGFFGVVVRFHLKLRERPKYSGMKMQVFRLRHMEELMAWADSIKHEVSPKVEMMLVFNRKAFGIFSHGIELVACVLADSRREAKQLLSFLDTSPVRRKASIRLALLGFSLQFIMKIGEQIMFWPNRMWFADNVWIKGPIAPALPLIRTIAEKQPEAPSHIYWQFWNPRKDRTDMAFSMEGDSYLALFGALKQSNHDNADKIWAVEGAKSLEKFSNGIQLADENLACRPAKFMAAENLDKLELIRAKYDPDRRFNSYGHVK